MINKFKFGFSFLTFLYWDIPSHPTVHEAKGDNALRQTGYFSLAIIIGYKAMIKKSPYAKQYVRWFERK